MIATVGHAGDGNLHPSIVVDSDRAQPAAEEIYKAALELGGTITGEHGIGSLKRDWLPAEIGEVGMDVQRALKDDVRPARNPQPRQGDLATSYRVSTARRASAFKTPHEISSSVSRLGDSS